MMPFPKKPVSRANEAKWPRRGPVGAWLLLSLLIIAFGSGCAGHSSKTLKARNALDRGDPEAARALINKELKVKEPDQIPAKEKKYVPLLVLDRSVISQSLRDYEASSSDLQYADKKIEMLDMSRTAVDDIGKYVFSDDTGPYKAPPYEKVMINTVNMQNYLARHDLNGARVEARRLAIIQKYLSENKQKTAALNAPGSYLAGFVFERSGRPDIALRYYDEAIAHVDFKTLVEPISRLSRASGYSTPTLREYLKRHGTEAQPTAESGATSEASTPSGSEEHWGEVLILINYGRVPAKEAKRLPIGLALTYASYYLSGPENVTANRLAAQGLVSWVNFPALEERSGHLSAPQVSLDGRPVLLEGAGAPDQVARKVHEAEKGKIIASAITRMISRAVAGEAAGAATRAASDSGLAGALVSLATQATLTAADTPDTRSWATLPARLAVGRVRLAPGTHTIQLSVQGRTRTETFELDPDGWHAVVMTVLR